MTTYKSPGPPGRLSLIAALCEVAVLILLVVSVKSDFMSLPGVPGIGAIAMVCALVFGIATLSGGESTGNSATSI